MRVFVRKAMLVGVATGAIVVSTLLTLEQVIAYWVRWRVGQPVPR